MNMLRDPRWRIALGFSIAASLASVLLVGVSAWFLGAVALAGLGPAGYAFAFHHPAAIVRLLALVRTGAKYGERITGHSAALRDQTRHRAQLFRQMADTPETRATGWQLSRTDRLQSFLDHVEQVDFAQLRSALPTYAAAGAMLVVSLMTLATVPLALPAIFVLGVLGAIISARLASRAAHQSHTAEAAWRSAAEELGQQLAGLVALEGGNERSARVGESIAHARRAEQAASQARATLGTAEAILGMLGPLAAAVVLGTAALTDRLGEAALPALLAAFAWLALGELILPLARARYAQHRARRATAGLSQWTQSPSSPPHTDHPVHPPCIEVKDLPLRNPNGIALGPVASFTARPGAPVAILGPSGCGKTTLLKALAGWTPWTDGRHPLGSATAARVTCHLSLHDAAILDGSVRDNLFATAPDEELWAALEAMEMTDRIKAAGGLDARLTQDRLSLGEARRIALARAYLTPAPVLLLDEPGEHLSKDQAARTLARLLAAQRDRTLVFVTHDEDLAALATQRVPL